MSWTSPRPTNCQACGGTLGKIFFDAFNSQARQWMIHCFSCFRSYKCRLGTGCGQKYDTKTLEKLGG